MHILEVNSNNIETLNSVLYYCYSLLNGCNNIELGSTSNNGKPFLKISEGDYLIEFKSEQIEIIYKVYKNHPPLDFTPNYNYYSDIKITINDIQIGEEFIEASVIFYKNEILREKNISNKVNVYTILNGGWVLFNKLNKRSIDTIYLPKNINIEILNLVKNFLSKNTIEKYESCGIPYKKNFILYGKPGTGKTSLIISISSELNLNLYFLTFDKNLNDSNFLRIIKNIKENSILVLEDTNNLFGEKKNVVSLMAILNILDGIAYKHGLIIFITTNEIKYFDQSLMRSGRIDHIFEFDNIKKKESKLMIQNIVSTFGNKNTNEINEFMESISKYRFTPADLQNYLINNINNLNLNTDELNKINNTPNFYH